MRTGRVTSRFAAHRGAVIATTAATTSSTASTASTAAIAGTTSTATANAALIVAVSLVVGPLLAGCGGDKPTGAAPPPRPASAGAPADPSAGPSEGSSGAASGSPGPASPTPRDDSPAAAGRVVEQYFREINQAAQDGRVADVSATALPGCQTCALDVGMTRLFAQRGVRADAAPYNITGLTTGERVGTVTDVRFTATVRDVGLLDPAGRSTGIQPGVPPRAGVAHLLLTGPGWRIQNITYRTGPP